MLLCMLQFLCHCTTGVLMLPVHASILDLMFVEEEGRKERRREREEKGKGGWRGEGMEVRKGGRR